MRISTSFLHAQVLLVCRTSFLLAFAPIRTTRTTPSTHSRASSHRDERQKMIQAPAKPQNESWDVTDDWSNLSSGSPINAIDGASIFNLDLASEAAKEMNDWVDSSEFQSSAEDDLISNAVDVINGPNLDVSAPNLYDTAESFDTFTKTERFVDEMGTEISLLVRCNESPEKLLVSLGRRLPELDDAQRYDASQLITDAATGTGTNESKSAIVPTDFFTSAIRAMFHMHALPSSKDANALVLCSTGIAAWMSQSLQEKLGKFDRRVNVVLGKYSSLGSGFLTEDQFLSLYMDAAKLARPLKPKRRTIRPTRTQDDQPTIRSVWRDIENHGFKPPIVEERELKQAEIDEKFGVEKSSSSMDMMDECEILEWKDDEHSNIRSSSSSQMIGASSDTKKSSHEFVMLASDNKTPSRLRDGEFVFIDEESCIGCKQCASVAPSAAFMLDSGRARMFTQSNIPEVSTAVTVCPVQCMHKVSFDELTEMETARDVVIQGDNQSLKRHIPLHVARMDSDVNRKSSHYHTLKHKCYTSKSCPQRGCFDCPMYDAGGDNPHFKKKHKIAEHVRATDLIETGEANEFRKAAEL